MFANFNKATHQEYVFMFFICLIKRIIPIASNKVLILFSIYENLSIFCKLTFWEKIKKITASADVLCVHALCIYYLSFSNRNQCASYSTDQYRAML